MQGSDKSQGPPERTPEQSPRLEPVEFNRRARKRQQPTIRTEGQRLLTCIPGTLRPIAAALGTSVQSVHNWRSGVKRPGAAARAKLSAALGIPECAWILRPGYDASTHTPLETESTDTPARAGSPVPTTREACRDLLEMIQRTRREPDLTQSERINLYKAETRILTLQAELEQVAELSDPQSIARHPEFIRMTTIILRALQPHPDAAQAVRAAIDNVFS